MPKVLNLPRECLYSALTVTTKARDPPQKLKPKPECINRNRPKRGENRRLMQMPRPMNKFSDECFFRLFCPTRKTIEIGSAGGQNVDPGWRCDFRSGELFGWVLFWLS